VSDTPRIEQLKRRVRSDPASIAFAALAEAYRRDGHYAEAIEICRVGLQRHPAYLSARVTLGRALIGAGDIEAARLELEAVLRVAPDNLSAIRAMADIYSRLHDAEVFPEDAITVPADLPAVDDISASEQTPPHGEPPPPAERPFDGHQRAIARLERFLVAIADARARLQESQAPVQRRPD
jgi:tetratricopeptide (TPR) repeat protein